MGNKTSKTTPKSEAIEKLNQAVAEAEAEFKAQNNEQASASENIADAKIETMPEAIKTEKASISSEKTSEKTEKSKNPKTRNLKKASESTEDLTSSTNQPETEKNKTTKKNTSKTVATVATTEKSSAASKPQPRRIKVETPGDSITVSRNKKSSQLKLPTVRKLHFKISHVIGAIVAILLIAFIARVAIWEHDYLNRMEGSERDTSTLPVGGIGAVDGEEEEVETERPTETEITEYVVAPDKPRYFTIPSLGIYNARIVEIGMKANGEIATPYNIYDVGWYTNSALPGTDRVTVMDGHGGGPGIGIFGSLPKISIGAEIFIEMGDGREYTYRVADTATKALGDEANEYMGEAFKSPEVGSGSLTLITCTGDYWLASKTYSHRFFMRAVLVQ